MEEIKNKEILMKTLLSGILFLAMTGNVFGLENMIVKRDLSLEKKVYFVKDDIEVLPGRTDLVHQPKFKIQRNKDKPCEIEFLFNGHKTIDRTLCENS